MAKMKKSWHDYFDRKDKPLKIIGIYAILLIFCAITTYPILNVLSVALRPSDNLFQSSLQIIPEGATLDNFKTAIFERPLLTWLKNSAIVSGLTTFFGVLLAVTTSYAYSRFKFKGREQTLTAFLLTQILPPTMLLLPMYVLFRKLNLINSFAGLTIQYVATAIPFSIWTLKGYFDTIPRTLEESAYIDGCGVVSAFVRVILPLATPALAISALFSFMTAWSEYVVARVMLSKKALYTLPIGLVSMQGEFNTEWGVYSAAALLTAIPAVIIFVAFSRYLVGGLSDGAVKG